MNKSLIYPLLLLMTVSVFASTTSAFQDEKEIRDVFSKLNDAIDDSDLKSASKLMTKNAVEEMCSDTFLMCIQIASEDMGMPEITDRLSEIVEDYGLDKIELPESLTNLESEEFPSEEEMKQVRKDVLKAVPAEERIELVSEIREVTEEFMLGDNPFAGEIENLEIKDNEASLTVELKELEEMMEDAEMEDDFEFEMMPIILKFKKTDGGWKWDGFDIEKTNAQMDDEDLDPTDKKDR